MKAVQIARFGNPADVAQCVDVVDVSAPGANEIVIAVEASPINQYYLLMIAGGCGCRPKLPAIMGTEGVGRVVAVGAGVKHLKEGDRTLVPFLRPAWAERTRGTSCPARISTHPVKFLLGCALVDTHENARSAAHASAISFSGRGGGEATSPLRPLFRTPPDDREREP